MSQLDDGSLTQEERAEILKRKLEMTVQKNVKQATPLSDLKKESGIPAKGDKNDI
ncbi:MAG: hypothetical protein ACRBCS_08405 [Cellvibrionaceae bacterium]